MMVGQVQLIAQNLIFLNSIFFKNSFINLIVCVSKLGERQLFFRLI